MPTVCAVSSATETTEPRSEFEQDVWRKSIFVYYKVMERDLPVTWKDAIARQERQDRVSLG
jgi:hypothetical protein